MAENAESSGVLSTRGVFLAWERLRLWYNIVLLAATVLLCLRNGQVPVSLAETPRFVAGFLPLAFAANICFFTGPVIETYARWLGNASPWTRPVIFAAGVAVSLLLCWAILSPRPGWD
jgi:hypothetical protein